MTDIPNISENTILTIWNDIKDFGVSFWAFMILFNIIFVKDKWIDIIKYCFDKLISVNKPLLKYTKKDVEKHRLFRDIDYWLSIGIQALQIKSTHIEEQDYIDNKEKMAKELFRIKLEVNKEYLSKFVEEIDFDNVDSDVCCSYFLDCNTKINITQKQKFIERGISPKFLNKYYVISNFGEKLITNSIKTIFSPSNNMNTATKMYVALNTVDGYLNIIYDNILESIDSINGDLKGETFDGEPMCKAYHTIIKAPHPTYPLIVKEKLSSVLQEFNGSRALIIKYYEKRNQLFHSAVYESTLPGITSEISNIQEVNDDVEINVMSILKENGCIAAELSKFGANTIERLNSRGVKGIIISPIINDGKIDGALIIDYLNIETFNDVQKRKDLDSVIKKETESFAPYIVYPKNYEF